MQYLTDWPPGIEVKEGYQIEPIYNKELLAGQVLLPVDVEPYDSDAALVEEIREFLNRWHEPISEEERMLDVHYVMLTYFAHMLPEISYRRVLAPYGKGKSAWLQSVGSICKRPIVTAGSSTAVSLLRLIDRWRGTALIDEADFPSSDEYSFITKILVLGYNRKTGWYYRAADKDAKRTLMYCVMDPN